MSRPREVLPRRRLLNYLDLSLIGILLQLLGPRFNLIVGMLFGEEPSQPQREFLGNIYVTRNAYLYREKIG